MTNSDAVSPELKIAGSKAPIKKKVAKKPTLKVKKKKSPLAGRKIGPRTYKKMGKSSEVSMLVTLEVIFPAEAIGSEMGEVVDEALESLRRVGAASVTKKELLNMTFNDACSVLDKHKVS